MTEPALEHPGDESVAEPRPADEPALEADRAAEMEDRWRRAVADLDNLRKRHARELERERGAERARVVREWLVVLDNLELALSHAGVDPAGIVEGVRAVRDQALSVLSRLGFARIAPLGEAFDPARHEAVSTAPVADAAPGTVVAVVRPGYGSGEELLRPAAVVVATEAS